ncbi:hypothetical protein U9M48_000184 [Paspalum notatum var. saurae]|uniref:Uncharacterized protein n=1 Tax=Paspalum notatum var. saurae TaxID=547442 RepID=A0AAQ3PKZ1_PASNO
MCSLFLPATALQMAMWEKVKVAIWKQQTCMHSWCALSKSAADAAATRTPVGPPASRSSSPCAKQCASLCQASPVGEARWLISRSSSVAPTRLPVDTASAQWVSKVRRSTAASSPPLMLCRRRRLGLPCCDSDLALFSSSSSPDDGTLLPTLRPFIFCRATS